MARRSTSLQSKAPFLPKVHIEREADCLLAKYGEEFGPIIGPPVLIEGMRELHLQLIFELIDLPQTCIAKFLGRYSPKYPEA